MGIAIKTQFVRYGMFVGAIVVAGLLGCSGSESDEGSSDDAGSDGITQVSNAVSLSPDNATIQFVGRHTDKSKDDRNGSFQVFDGQLSYDEETQAPESLTLTIETQSLETPIDKLTDHLKGTDFFNVRQYPEAKFSSVKIEPTGDQDVYTITGNLTLLEKEVEISFPAKMTGQGSELSLAADFEIDRMQFGMDYGPDQIEKMVGLSLQIGTASETAN